MSTRIVFYTPTFTPVGGVVKVFDYINHALELGYEPHIVCPEPLTDDSKIWDLDQFRHILESVNRTDDLHHPLSNQDIAFFSWPTHYRQISRSIPSGYPHHRIVHIVQNVRHGNPRWIDGYATRLLARPMSRIMISNEVDDACRPWLNPRSPTVTIVEGHYHEYFARERLAALERPIRVGYTTWKSDVGIEVEERLRDDDRFVFRSIRQPAGWEEIRNLYHWAGVVLGCPGPEEGFYLVGLEALAAGAILIMSDAVGNRAYARWGHNCLKVEHDDASSYVDALMDVASWADSTVHDMRQNGYATVANHGLSDECSAFGSFLVDHVLADTGNKARRRKQLAPTTATANDGPQADDRLDEAQNANARFSDTMRRT